MRIYMPVDMEGICGIACREQTTRGAHLYMEGRRLMAGDINAAARGAFDGGATEVIAVDTHADSFNFLIEEIDPRVRQLLGCPTDCRFPLLDERVDGVFLLGYHAMVGTRYGLHEHTMSSARYHNVTVNGRSIGELGIDAGIAAQAGVPTVFVSGDEKICAEAQAWLDRPETACVKQSFGRHFALCLSPEEGRKRIYEAAKRAVERLKAGEKFRLLQFEEPVTVRITYKHSEDADATGRDRSARRIDGFTVEKTYERFSDWYGGLWTDPR